MDYRTLFGHDVYVDNNRVGYIARSRGETAAIFFGGSKLGVLTYEGIIEIKGVSFGHIEDNMAVFIHNRRVGKVDENKDIRFELKPLTKAIEGGK